tara:strand:+ start:2837 stop:3253 length:417 start_codon:yes stop_codon:yes gene_type:complete
MAAEDIKNERLKVAYAHCTYEYMNHPKLYGVRFLDLERNISYNRVAGGIIESIGNIIYSNQENIQEASDLVNLLCDYFNLLKDFPWFRQEELYEESGFFGEIYPGLSIAEYVEKSKSILRGEFESKLLVTIVSGNPTN